jgi:hypothetical protein
MLLFTRYYINIFLQKEPPQYEPFKNGFYTEGVFLWPKLNLIVGVPSISQKLKRKMLLTTFHFSLITFHLFLFRSFVV